MQTKKCTVDRLPDPPPPDPCLLKKIRDKEKAGIKICPKPPVLPSPPPDCFALCIERVKNPPLPPSKEQALPCPVKRQPVGTSRCDEILAASAAHPDLPWPSCPPPPLPPPTPKLDPCEEKLRREKIAECKARKQRYLE